MSILFGLRAADEQSVDESHLRSLARATERYGLDGTSVRAVANVGMGVQLYRTHERSRLEAQPVINERGSMISFDGRLDNHKDLCEMLGLPDRGVADSEIVLAAFECWGENCFGRFIGDWALALWASAERVLYLARDHAGTRTLYYEMSQGRVYWATYLETFFAHTPNRSLDQAYIARYLASLPVLELTPYKGIRAVAPAHYLRIRGDQVTCRQHWSWLAKDEIRYRTDTEYEEHFFSLFKQAVERRTGSGAPILAQLSGGMDSSSIVCMSDYIRAHEGRGTGELLDTISYYDDSEPNWDERSFFEAVERKRGKRGIHLSHSLLSEELAVAPVMYLWPGADRSTYDNERRLIEQTEHRGYRVILSGIGGDELLGGVPTPLPELADLIARGDLAGFFRSALAWCLVDRTPLFHMAGSALRFLVQQHLPIHTSQKTLPSWATSQLKRNLSRSSKESKSAFASWSRPSSTADARMRPLLETMPHRRPLYFVRWEWRYPYLDRDLDDFLVRVPSKVLVRPGRRRAMMRNALKTILPPEIVERRRKAARSRSVLWTLRGQDQKLGALFDNLPFAMADLVDQKILQRDALKAVRQGDPSQMHAVLRAIFIGLWSKQFEGLQEVHSSCSFDCEPGSAA